MNSTAVSLLMCLLALYAQGQPIGGSNKCKCLNGFISGISKSQMRGGPEVHPPNSFCQQVEIIVTTTDNKQKCLDPKKPLGKKILHMAKNAKIRATTAGSTSSQRTTSPQRTTRL